MIEFNDLNPFEENNDLDWDVPPREPDVRGYIYIVKNRFYPDIFKIGRTNNLVRRLKEYNGSQPMITTDCLIISMMFKDCYFIETRILKELRHLTEPLQYRLEWFSMEQFDRARELIIAAEEWEKSNGE